MSERGGGSGGVGGRCHCGGGGQSPAPDASEGQQVSRGLSTYHIPALSSDFSCDLGDIGRLGNGLMYWKGFYQSTRPTQMGLSLNIDMPFFEPVLVSEYVAKNINNDLTRGLSDQDRIKVNKALKGVRVETHHLGHIRLYEISGITTQSTQQLLFHLDGTGAEISVAQYFSEKYNAILQYPFLPAVQAGSDAKPIYLPMELCRIVEGQRCSRKWNKRQVSALLKATCQRPDDRKKSITEMVEGFNNYNQDELVNKAFGINVRPPPMKVINGGKVEFWACINFSRLPNMNVGKFCDDLIDMCCSKGMECSRQPLVIHNAQPIAIEKALLDVEAWTSKLGKRLELLIVILPDFSGSYETIKRVCETELGIVSQCCQPKNISGTGKQYMQYMENVSLKINAKVGGRNSLLDLSDHPTIVFGADVTDDSSPSIAPIISKATDMDIPIKTISEIEKEGKTGEFWVHATIHELVTIGSSPYLACKHCLDKLEPDGDQFYCKNCPSIDIEGKPRYKLTVRVHGDNGEANFLLWTRECVTLIGKTATDLNKNGELDELPMEIECMNDKTALFKVVVKEGQTEDFKGEYDISKVISDPEEIINYYEHQKAAKMNDSVEKPKKTKDEGNEDTITVCGSKQKKDKDIHTMTSEIVKVNEDDNRELLD